MAGALTEYEKMKRNIPFNPSDEELTAVRAGMREAELAYNSTTRYETERRTQIIQSVLGSCGADVMFLPDIHFDYGCNVFIGDHFFANVNSTFLDVASITIGNYVLVGPNVTFCTAKHPIAAARRRPQSDEQGAEFMLEYSDPITIGNDVWIGAGVIINPGVHIGDRAVIGSGSVVTRDIPPDVVAAGVPCRVMRKITEEDNIIKERQ